MERLRSRMERLRAHHHKCEAAAALKVAEGKSMEGKSAQSDDILEKNWSNSVSITAHQTIQENKWSKDDDIPLTKNVIALRDHLRMVEDEANAIEETLRGKNLNSLRPSVSGESPASTSVSQRQTKKRRPERGRDVDEDGCSDDFSPQKAPEQCSEDGVSDVVDQEQGANRAKKPSSPKKKKKREEKLAKETTRISVKRPWCEEERRSVNKHLARFAAERRVPGKADCMKCLEEEKVLKERCWKDVKNFVYNTIVTKKRRSASRMLLF